MKSDPNRTPNARWRTAIAAICGMLALSAPTVGAQPAGDPPATVAIAAQEAGEIVQSMFGPNVTRGALVEPAPFAGWWTIWSPNSGFNPILVSEDGRRVVSGTVAYERAEQGGKMRHRELPSAQARELIERMRAGLKPEAALRRGEPADAAHVVFSAPSCSFCLKLEGMLDANPKLGALMVPTSISPQIAPHELYSRVMCAADPLGEFRRSIQSGGRYIPPATPGCDKRAQGETLWVYHFTHQRAYTPAWFKAGREARFDWTRADVLSATLASR